MPRLRQGCSIEPGDLPIPLLCLEAFDYPANSLVLFFPHFEVPDADNRPSGFAELSVHMSISPHVALDLSIPILTGSAWSMSRRVSVPKCSIYKDGEPESRPSQIGSSWCFGVVASPTPYAHSIQGMAKRKLRGGPSLPHGRHDPPPLLRCSRVGQRREHRCTGRRSSVRATDGADKFRRRKPRMALN